MIQDYGFRLYNPAIAKFLSVDPLSPNYPELTPYQFASNSPIANVDLDGLEADLAIYPTSYEGQFGWDGDQSKFEEKAQKFVKKHPGFGLAGFETGKELVEQLESATKAEGSVRVVATIGHGDRGGIHAKSNAGFYINSETNTPAEIKSGARHVSNIAKKIDAGDIILDSESYFAFLNTCNGYTKDMDPETGKQLSSLAYSVVTELKRPAVGAIGTTGSNSAKGLYNTDGVGYFLLIPENNEKGFVEIQLGKEVSIPKIQKGT